MGNKEGKKILVIEDDKFISDIYSTKLSSEGFRVILAENGEEGVKKIKSEQPDLILLDLFMPKMDGIEVLKKMKTDGISIMTLVLTNAGENEYVAKAMELGAEDYLIKTSFTPDEVILKIKEKLGMN